MIFVVAIYGFVISFTSLINCFTVACTKTTFEPHYDFTMKLVRWLAHIEMYTSAATEDKPPNCP